MVSAPSGDSLSYRRNAYDNIVVRREVPGPAITSGILDAIEDLAKDASIFGLQWQSAARVYRAFRYYREAISDHLPAKASIPIP